MTIRHLLSGSRSRCAFGLMPVTLAFVIALVLGLAHPFSAYAYFNEVDEQGAAQQDLGHYGAEILPSQIPDGVYEVAAHTSSRMCVFYETAEAAAGYDTSSRELCTLSVRGGSITAVFYLSRAYTYLFMGTSEQAAAATNATGDDDSAYIKGEADAQATSHLFTMAVPALNLPIEFASFDGGTRGIEGGKWYQREVVFTPIAGSPLEKAINGEVDDGGDDGGDGGDEGGGQEGGNAGDGNGSGGSVDDPGSSDNGKKPDSGSQGAGESARTAGSGGQVPQGAAATSSEAPDKPASQDSVQEGSKGSANNGGAVSAKRGVLMSPAQMKQAELPADVVQAAPVEQVKRGLSPAQVVAIVLVVLAIGGALWRIVLFKRGIEKRSSSADSE